MKTNKLFLLVLFLVVGAFVYFPNQAKAAPSTGFEFMYFRIDTELDVLNDKGITITFTCDAETTVGLITDGTASESTNLADGIVKIASTSAELDNCDSTDTVTATVSFNGWVTRTFTGTVTASTSDGETDPFTMRASQDYNFVVNGIEDELDNALTLDGTTASVSYSGTTASASYSGGKRYLAITDTGGTLTGGADGYVNQTLTLSSIVSTASQAGDFGLSATSGNDGSGLPFGLKVTLNVTSRSGVTESKTGATVTAGDSLGVSCTDNSDGKYYCAIPLAETETSAQGVANGYDTNTATYTDRTAGGDAQSTVTFVLAESAAGGGVPPATPTPTPTPTPSPSPTVTPTPTSTPTPTPTPTPAPTGLTPVSRGFVSLVELGLAEGDTVSAAGSDDPDIYIANEHGYKRLFLNPAIFGFYGHLGGFEVVKSVPSVTRDTLVTSGLYRNCETNDEKVYGVEVTGEDTGVLHWVNTTGEQAVADDPEFFKKVFCINSNEFNWYEKSSDYSSVNQIPDYSR